MGTRGILVHSPRGRTQPLDNRRMNAQEVCLPPPPNHPTMFLSSFLEITRDERGEGRLGAL